MFWEVGKGKEKKTQEVDPIKSKLINQESPSSWYTDTLQGRHQKNRKQIDKQTMNKSKGKPKQLTKPVP